MLENVFSKTKLIQRRKAVTALSLKYEPRNTSECCISENDLLNVRRCLENERFFAVHSETGCGATICVKCIANEMGSFFVHELSCSNGCSEVIKLIKQHMKNVLPDAAGRPPPRRGSGVALPLNITDYCDVT